MKDSASSAPARRKTPSDVWLAFCIGLVFAVVGACVFVWFLGALLDKRRVASEWPLAEATVLRSEFVRNDNPRGGPSYSAFLSWTWERDGLRYENDNTPSGLDFRHWSSSPAEPRKKVDAHPAGSRLAIRVDPDNPARSVIDEPPPAPGEYALLLIPVAFILFSAVPFGIARATKRGRTISID